MFGRVAARRQRCWARMLEAQPRPPLRLLWPPRLPRHSSECFLSWCWADFTEPPDSLPLELCAACHLYLHCSQVAADVGVQEEAPLVPNWCQAGSREEGAAAAGWWRWQRRWLTCSAPHGWQRFYSCLHLIQPPRRSVSWQRPAGFHLCTCELFVARHVSCICMCSVACSTARYGKPSRRIYVQPVG
jgi:hypothetical protein